MMFRTLVLVSSLLVAACAGGAPGADPQETGGSSQTALPTAQSSQALLGGFGLSDAMDIAASGLGFSYWWGGGCWNPGSTSWGDCNGSCPSCSHSGKWGADCSGYVAKVWQVPNRSDADECRHPYSTDDFYNTEREWRRIPRGNVQRGDAFVYRSGGAGHIFIYGSDDPWGWMKAYEAKGCSYGIVHDLRTATSDYRTLRRDGF